MKPALLLLSLFLSLCAVVGVAVMVSECRWLTSDEQALIDRMRKLDGYSVIVIGHGEPHGGIRAANGNFSCDMEKASAGGFWRDWEVHCFKDPARAIRASRAVYETLEKQ